jgi:Flp pilus assembly secretin CpaC
MRICYFALLVMATATFAAAQESEPAAEKSSPKNSDQVLLQAKLAELNALQAEIGALRKKLRQEQQLLIQIQMLEALPKRFEESGEKLHLDGTRDELGERLERWRRQRLVRVLAEPQVVTVIGRPASFHVGGKLLLPAAGKNSVPTDFGTLIDVLATAADDGTMQLNLRAHHSMLDSEHTASVDGQVVPSLIVREVNTSAQLLPEQTLAVASFVTEQLADADSAKAPPPDRTDAAGDSTELIVLVTVHFVDAMAPAPGPNDAKSGYGRPAARLDAP